jgi:hypothetical protein
MIVTVEDILPAIVRAEWMCLRVNGRKREAAWAQRNADGKWTLTFHQGGSLTVPAGTTFHRLTRAHR